MRILVISYEYPPIGGGGATYCQELAEAMVEAGHAIDVVTSGMSDLPVRESRRGVQIHRVPCFRRHRHHSTIFELATQLWPSYRKARSLTRERRYDISHTHFVVPSGLVAYALHQATGLPYVLTGHGSDIPGYNPHRFHLTHRLLRPVWRRILGAARTVHTPSKFLGRLIHRHTDVPFSVVPYGFQWPETAEETVRERRILVVSRLVKRKGVQYLLRALRDTDAEWEIVVAGDGPYRSPLVKLADELGLEVLFPGFVQGEDLRILYRSSELFVLPSTQENFPMVLLEAMAGGCAIVTTSAPGCAEVVGDAAVKVEPANAEELRRALSWLMDDCNSRRDLQRKARDRARQFEWPRIVTRMESLFREQLSEPIASDQLPMSDQAESA